MGQVWGEERFAGGFAGEVGFDAVDFGGGLESGWLGLHYVGEGERSDGGVCEESCCEGLAYEASCSCDEDIGHCEIWN